MSDTYNDLSLSCLVLFSESQLQPAALEEEFTHFFSSRNWQMDAEKQGGGERRYTGSAGDYQCQCSWVPAHDVLLLRVQFLLPGQASLSAFLKLSSTLKSGLAGFWEHAEVFKPWALTLLYQLPISSEITLSEAERLSGEIRAQIGVQAQQAECYPSPYGILSMLEESEYPQSGDSCIWKRSLLLLTPEDRLPKVASLFLQPLNQGLNRIELYLHKCLHLTRQYFLIQNKLSESQAKLRNLVSSELIDKDLEDVRQENRELDRIANVLMRLLVMKAQLDILLNSLTLNLKAYQDHLDLVQLEIPLYAKKATRLGRYIESLQVDIENARIAIESSYTFQEIQRSLEASRFERASFLLGATAALLAGVTIFNSYLDIWSLVVNDSNLVLPSPLIRMLLGLLAAVSWPLAAFWGAMRKKWAMGLAIVGGILSLVLTIIVSAKG